MIVEFVDEVCGVYFRSIVLENEGDVVTQHIHDYDHATYIGNGSVVVCVEGEPLYKAFAGQAIAVKANKRHIFRALEPNTRLTCVHNVESAESIKRKKL